MGDLVPFPERKPDVILCTCGVMTGGHRLHNASCPLHGTAAMLTTVTEVTYGGTARTYPDETDLTSG